MTERDRLIEIIEKARAEAVSTIGSMNNGFAVWYADKLMESGVVIVHGWIPVTESLPEYGERVLTYDRYGHIRDRVLRKAGGTDLFTPDGLYAKKHITHWMPLPEKPEEDADA